MVVFMIMQVFFTTRGAVEDSGQGQSEQMSSVHLREYISMKTWKAGKQPASPLFGNKEKSHLKCLAGSSRADDEVDDCCFSH
jgi:hypothetical protein